MIGAIADVVVETPPASLLGRFTEPGNPDLILRWLEGRRLSDYRAIIVSTDMIAYGGLIASRENDVTYEEAIGRLRHFQRLRRKASKVPVYAISSIMRLTPTATRDTAGWRMELGRFVELRSRYHANPNPQMLDSLRNLRQTIPATALERYDAARARNLRVQQELVRMTSQNVFTYLVFGQDDAAVHGPHIGETARLRQMCSNLNLGSRMDFCMGIDQHANVLLSRALLREANWTPKVRVVYADPFGRQKVAAYESIAVEAAILDQIRASGARLGSELDYDYSLFVNTPEPREHEFAFFRDSLKREIDEGFPVAVADINLGKSGTGDPALFDALTEAGRAVRLIAYAGWNTAGNTIGTTIPAANVFLLARFKAVDPLQRETAQRAFLLHRLVNDFQYHRFTRPMAFAMIDANPRASRDETSASELETVDQFVRDDLGRRLEEMFRGHFLGRRFFAGPRQYVFRDLADVDVDLPWPRAYEVRLRFRLVASEVGEVFP
jgi:hypothetical protein